jgi:hypothetical protein
MYETSVMLYLVKQFSVKSEYCTVGNRKFGESEEKDAFNATRKKLAECKWSDVSEGSLDFNELEMDCVLHVCDKKGTDIPSELIRYIIPLSRQGKIDAKTLKPTAILQKKISHADICEVDANCYVVFEVYTYHFSLQRIPR